jgi:hypothetical protein
MAIRLAMSIGINNVAGDKFGEVAPPGLCKREVGSPLIKSIFIHCGLALATYMVQYCIS